MVLAFYITIAQTSFAQDPSGETDGLVGPLPELLLSLEGRPIETAGQWEQIRHPELLELFREHMYGRVPRTPVSIRHRLMFSDRNALQGLATMKEVHMEVVRNADTLDMALLIFLPNDRTGPVPLFLGLNFNGNHTVLPDPQIAVTDTWVRNNRDLGIADHRAREDSRGSAAERWQVELILSRGCLLYTSDAADDLCTV